MTTKLPMLMLVSTLMVYGCTQRTPEMQLIYEAGEAMGGANSIVDADTLLFEGEGRQFRFGQAMAPGDPLPYWEVDEYRREIDLGSGNWRVVQTRSSAFLTGNPALRQEQTFGVDGDVAYNITADGTVQRVGAQVAADRMSELYHHPAVLIKLAMTEGSTVDNMRQADGQDVIDITSAAGKTYTMFIAGESRYPTRIESMGYDPNFGDVALASNFEDYWETGGLGGFGARLTMPRQISASVDGKTTWTLRVTTQVDQDLGDLGAPADARSASAPEFQPDVQVIDVADGVWQLAGQSHHSVLVEFDDYLALVEAPQNEARTLAVIAKARELQPDKPLQYVVNTHHHSDHSGGIRAAVSEGLTIIAHASNEAFYRDLVQRPHTMNPDALARNPQDITLELVNGYDVFELSNGRRTLQVARIARDEHARAILMAYLPRERILIEADAFSANSRVAPFAPNLLEAVNDLEWQVDQIVAIHGPIVEFAALEEAVEQESVRR
jgi:hypothetical protein